MNNNSQAPSIPFRIITPKRRADRRICIDYKSYKKTLKEDFNSRCGYCNAFDKIKVRSFTIDHFVPQQPENFKCTIEPNKYDNLVYSCFFCNSAKTNKWPTNDESSHNNGNQGFIDPVDEKYAELFCRSSDGKIKTAVESNKLAEYIHRELKFDKIIHSITYTIEIVDSRIDELETLIQESPTKMYSVEKNQLLDVFRKLVLQLQIA